MRLKALLSFATRDFSMAPGQEFECSECLAEDLLAAKYAVKVEEASKVENAVLPAKDEPAEPAVEKAKTKQTKKEETKNDNKSGDKKRVVSTAKGKRGSSK